MLDDVAGGGGDAGAPTCWPASAPSGLAVAPVTAWFVRVTSAAALPHGADIADLLGAHGVWAERTTGTRLARWQGVAGGPDLSLRQAASRTRGGRALRGDGIDTHALPGAGAARVKRCGFAGARQSLLDQDRMKELTHGVRDTHDSRGAAVGAGHRFARCADFSDIDVRAGGAGRPSGLRLLAHEQPDARAPRSGPRRSRRREPRGGIRVGARRGERRAPGLAQARRRNRHPARRLRRHLPAPDEGLPAARLRHPPDRRGRHRGALERALPTRTKLVWIESPTNPRLLVYDIAAIAAAAHAPARCWSSTTPSPRPSSSSPSNSAPTSSCTA